MDILLLLAFSALLYYVCRFINGKTGISLPVLYLAAGVLAGLGIRHFGMEFTDIFPHISVYNNVALFTNLFTAGLSINIKQIRESGKMTAKLCSLPCYTEALLLSGVVYLILTLAGGSLGIELSYSECLVVTAVLCAASIINILPACTKIIRSGSKSRLPQTMIVSAILDGILPVPLMMVALTISIAAVTGEGMKPMMMVLMAAGVLICLALFTLIGIIIGKLIMPLVTPILKKIKENPQDRKWTALGVIIPVAISSAVLLFLCGLPKVGTAASIFVYLSMCAMGAVFNNCDKFESAAALSSQGSRFFSAFGMPAVFMFVGARLKLEYFLKPSLILVGALICVFAVLIKSSVAYILAKRGGCSRAESRFAAACFAPKGVTLINFSVIFLPILSSAGMLYILDFMTMVGAVTILLTMTFGVNMLNKATDGVIAEGKI